MVSSALFSSARDDWQTPNWLFRELDSVFHFTLDAAASHENAKCARYFTKEDDALSQVWTGRVWLNPPYGRNVTGKWVEKAFYSACTTAELVVCLIPARTDTRWFHNYVQPYARIHFVRGRLKFDDGKNGAPFPSLICKFGEV